MDFVAIDFETANSYRASACAVGMVRVVDGEVCAEESFLIKPPSSLGGFGAIQMGVHGIKPRDVADAPGWQESHTRILDFIGDDYVVAHNTGFDMSVIQKSQELFNLPVPDISHYCSVNLSRAALPTLGSHKLNVVAKALGIGRFNHHVASEDALVAAQICLRIAERTGDQSISSLMQSHRVSAKHLGRGKILV